MSDINWSKPVLLKFEEVHKQALADKDTEIARMKQANELLMENYDKNEKSAVQEIARLREQVEILSTLRMGYEISRLRAELDKYRWIPVSESPDKDDIYIVMKKWNTSKFRSIDNFRNGKWDSGILVTHWMPLPSAPEEQNE